MWPQCTILFIISPLAIVIPFPPVLKNKTCHSEYNRYLEVVLYNTYLYPIRFGLSIRLPTTASPCDPETPRRRKGRKKNTNSCGGAFDRRVLRIPYQLAETRKNSHRYRVKRQRREKEREREKEKKKDSERSIISSRCQFESKGVCTPSGTEIRAVLHNRYFPTQQSTCSRTCSQPANLHANVRESLPGTHLLTFIQLSLPLACLQPDLRPISATRNATQRNATQRKLLLLPATLQQQQQLLLLCDLQSICGTLALCSVVAPALERRAASQPLGNQTKQNLQRA